MLLAPLILFLSYVRFSKFFHWKVKGIFVFIILVRALINNFIWDLGYANEVGESFRQLVSIKLVRLSYIIASTYCLADASSKAKKIVSNKSCPHLAFV